MITTLPLPSRRANLIGTERGAVLILAVFAVALLLVLTVAIMFAVRGELLASRAGLERMQSLFLAEAGINRARSALLYDAPNMDALTDKWGPENEAPLDLPQDPGSGFYRARVIDGCGLIDINQVDVATLSRLTGDPVVANAIVEWRNRNAGRLEWRNPNAVRSHLSGSEFRENARNKVFQTIGELLLVPDLQPSMLYAREGRPGFAEFLSVESISLNTDAKGERRIGLNEFRNWDHEAFRNQVMAKLGSVLEMYDMGEIFRGLSDLAQFNQAYTSLAQLATVVHLDYAKIIKAIDYLAVDGSLQREGLVNVNTAPAEVLSVLPGSSPALAEAIIMRRREQPFVSLGEVVEVLLAQQDGEDAFIQMIDRITTKSSSYVIESMGWTEAGRAFRTLRASVRRQSNEVAIVQQVEEDWPLPPPGERQPRIAMRR